MSATKLPVPLPMMSDEPVQPATADRPDSPEFRAFAEKEFPGFLNVYEGIGEVEVEAGALDRRKFMALSAAGLAMAGLAGCRRPDLKVLPYSQTPDNVIAGLPTFYATSMPRPGGAFPILVESHEGRPTKVEGNPKHPFSQGATDLYCQASVLDVYSPVRGRTPLAAGVQKSWDDFDSFANQHFAKLRTAKGAGLHFLTEAVASPALRLIKATWKEQFPEAVWHVYEPLAANSASAGTKMALGSPMLASYQFDRVTRILALDSDFLGADEQQVANSKGFSKLRQRLLDHQEGDRKSGEEHGHEWDKELNRLYVVEPGFTVTGGMADHRLRLPALNVGDYALQLAKALAAAGVSLPGALNDAVGKAPPSSAKVPPKWLEAVAKDLAAAKGKAVILAGPKQPAWVHALVALLNDALGATGTAIEYRPLADEGAEDLVSIVDAMNGSRKGKSDYKLETLVVFGGNPTYNAPADLKFAESMKKVPTVIRVGDMVDETAANGDWKAAWYLPLAHYLESWGDAETLDGSYTAIQPLIAPLWDSRSMLECLVLWSGYDKATTYAAAKVKAFDLVQRSFYKRLGKDDYAAFQKFLHEGFLPGTARPAAKASFSADGLAKALGDYKPATVSKENMEVCLVPSHGMYDGRYAANGWMFELPDPVTKLVWDNAAVMSPATAAALGCKQDDVVKITTAAGSIEIAAFPLPGHCDNSITVALGFGKLRLEHVEDGGGVSAYPLLSSTGGFAVTAKVEKTGGTYELVVTQQHGTIPEGREVIPEYKLGEYSELGHAHGKPADEKHPKTAEGHHDAEEHGDDHGGGHGHAESPVQRSFKAKFQFGYAVAKETIPSEKMISRDLATPEKFDYAQQWGMVVDLNTCTGCSACVIACQAENNIPIVGKNEVRRNREMHWIRLDRYFSSDGIPHIGQTGPTVDEDPRIVVQPMMCQHCEAAPCESVCPVNAAVHSPEGLNLQVYNRCIGTRYCSNNCPYKVRRFNWFNFNERHLDSLRVPTFVGQVNAGTGEADSLTAKGVPETLKMQKNPDVTVRIRGVMEKCTYCMQRIERAKIGAKVLASKNDYVKPSESGIGKKVAAELAAKGLKGDRLQKAVTSAVGYDMAADGKTVLVPDGTIVTACAQACPSNAIVFGNVADERSKVYQLKQREADFLVLGSVNAKPRTSYLPRVRNLNPEMVAAPSLEAKPEVKKEANS